MPEAEKIPAGPDKWAIVPAEFEAIFNALADGIVALDLDRHFTHANPAFLEMMEYSYEELLRLDFKKVTPPEFGPSDELYFNEVLRSRRVGPIRKQYIRRSGTRFWVEITAVLTTGPGGVRRIWCLVKNVDAEQRQAAQLIEQRSLLEKSVSLLQATIESTADGIIAVDRAGKIGMFNQKFGELWRIPADILESHEDERLLSFVLSQLKEPESFLDRVRVIYSHPERETFDTLDFKDGRVFERFSKPQWLDKKIAGRVWSFREVTGRVRAELALKESEEKFRALSEATFEAVLIHDQGKILLANKGATDLFGYSAAELIGMNAFQLVAPESREWVRNGLQSGVETPVEALDLRKDGSKFWAEYRPRSFEYRGITARVVAIHDISKRKKAEERLRQTAEEFRAAFEVAAVGKAQVDPASGRMVRANKKLSDITGYPLDELQGMRFLDLIHPDDRVKGYDSFHEMVQGQIPEYTAERRSIRKDGAQIWINVNVAPIRDSEGHAVSAIAVIQDITDRILAERERDRHLAEAQSAISVRDDFISIASHELRTPLTPLKMQVQLLKRQMQSPDRLASREVLGNLLNDSERQIERLGKLVENLLDVSRLSAGSFDLSFETEVDLKEVVDSSLEKFAKELKATNCPVQVACEEGVKGSWDKVRLEQVVDNLLSNAVKFGPGKPIEIRMAREGENAVLSVTDHGIGIDPTFKAKIFDRFERDVPVTEFGGLGLGLYISYQIVKGHGGFISVESNPGIWTTFQVTIPVTSSRQQGRG